MTETTSPKTISLRKGPANLARRNKAERRFRLYGVIAITVAVAFLGALLLTIFSTGISAFQQIYIALDIEYSSGLIDPKGTKLRDDLSRADYQGLVKQSLRDAFPKARKRRAKRQLYKLISNGAGFDLREKVLADPSLIGQKKTVWLLASDDVDMMVKGKISLETSADNRRISDNQVLWIRALAADGRLEKRFNWRFFTSGDSREPEMAGILSAVMGSFFSLTVCLMLAFPLGVMTATYLEEFAPKNRWTDIIEININNLAAVPSIVFGLLGLAVFLNFFELPRSAPLVGGIVLALMTLPTIIISSRAALKAVPPSIREAALGVGASPVQTVAHHVVPLAMPGILTGTIIGMAQALGETAPLLMIGMVAFIVDVPQSFTDPATALPVQIFLWADSPERAFLEKTSAAIMVLLAFLIGMNLLAVILRKKFEKRW